MSEECLLHTDSLRSRLLCAGVLYSELPVVSWAITGSLGVIVAVDCVLSPTDRGNGLASSSRPGEWERGRGGEGERGGGGEGRRGEGGREGERGRDREGEEGERREEYVAAANPA